MKYRGSIGVPSANSYLAFQGKPGDKRYPILAGFEDAAYTVNCIRSVNVDLAGAQADAPITLIPSYPDLPMEYVYERAPRGNTPQVFLRERGRAHTVNFPTNPMMMKGPMRELTPIGEQRVRVRVHGSRAVRAKLLVSGRSASVKMAANYAEVLVPSILDHEVVVVQVNHP